MSQAQAVAKKPFPPGMPVRPGDVIAGKYQVDDMVAVGGMGVVVRATHLSLGHQVAIKVLLPEEASDSQQAVPRFLREARAAAGIHGDHVVRIYDVDTLESGLPYMVMELLNGLDLRRVVKTKGPLSVQQVVEFVLQAADAIGQAHDLGIVHRDLKPSNLFLTERSDGKPLVKVLDFGISKASRDPLQEGTLTTTRAMMGSPMYMSPEQVRDAKSVDGRSDIWSLGVIMHELLTGRPAFRGDSLPAICASIAADPPAPLREKRPDVPLELEAIVMRCLEKDAARRYSTIAELRRVLLPFSGRDASMPVATSGAGRVSLDSIPQGSTLVSPLVGETPTMMDASGSSERLSRQEIETLPTQRFERSEPHAPSSAYQEVMSNPNILRPPGVGIAPSDAPFAATGMQAGASRSRIAVVAVVALVGLAAAATAVGFSLRTRSAPAATEAAAPVAAGFELTLESVPPGAEVFEGDRLLGKTPAKLRVDGTDLAAKPRVFRFELDGYAPYEHSQGPSPEDVTIRAKLRAVAAAAPSAPATSEEPVAAPTKAKSKRVVPSTRATTPDNSHGSSTDIRLSR
jgi:serine/threonine protein kinase